MLGSIGRTALLYGLILLAVRVMGKRQVSQLQTSELVSTLLLSELAVLPIQQGDGDWWQGLAPMGTLVACELAASWGMLKSGRFRQAVCGRPQVVVQNGRLLRNQMRSLRLTAQDLFEQLRQNGVFRLEDVAWAIVETNGLLSVVRKPEADWATPAQLGLSPPPAAVELVVLCDGEVFDHSLALCGKDAAWVDACLAGRGLTRSQVFLMTASTDGSWQVVEQKNAT